MTWAAPAILDHMDLLWTCSWFQNMRATSVNQNQTLFTRPSLTLIQNLAVNKTAYPISSH